MLKVVFKTYIYIQWSHFKDTYISSIHIENKLEKNILQNATSGYMLIVVMLIVEIWLIVLMVVGLRVIFSS